MKLTIRLDDITPQMNMEKFRRFTKLMDRYGIKPLLGVVPDAQDEKLRIVPVSEEEETAFWEMLRTSEKNGYRIAMHGLTHVYATNKGGLFPLNLQSEFAGRSFEEQDAMLRTGKELLLSHGISTDIFMAPSHTFDENTLKALRHNGFRAITDGFGTAPYSYHGITFYPISFLRKRSINDTSEEKMTTLVVHTNTVTENECKAYEALFRSGRFVPYTVWETLPVKELSFAGHARHYLMAGAKRVILRNQSTGGKDESV